MVTPPGYDITADHGMDFRDWFNEGHSIEEYLALVAATSPVTEEQIAEWSGETKSQQPAAVGQPTTPLPAIAVGTVVKASDRNNFGTIVADHGQTCIVHFRSPDGREAEVELSKSELRTQDGAPLDPSAGVDIGPPEPLSKIIHANPRLRRSVIKGLLREGETGNLIAPPKMGKSWLRDGLAFAVAEGCEWLDTFLCRQGRVLIIDGELHMETLAYRMPMVAEAMGRLQPVQTRSTYGAFAAWVWTCLASVRQSLSCHATATPW